MCKDFGVEMGFDTGLENQEHTEGEARIDNLRKIQHCL